MDKNAYNKKQTFMKNKFPKLKNSTNQLEIYLIMRKKTLSKLIEYHTNITKMYGIPM